MLTSTFKLGRLEGWDDHDHERGLIEFSEPEPSSFDVLAAAATPSMAVRLQSPESRRANEFMAPVYGFGDELRVTMRDRGGVWGCLALHRDRGQPHFSLADVALLEELSPVLARGVRSGILTLAAREALHHAGPAVILVDSSDQILMLSDTAEERLAELTAPDGGVVPTGIIAGLIAAARRYSSGESTRPPRCRVRGGSDAWFSLYATSMQGRDGERGQVAVTIDEARPPEIVPLVVSAFNLTERERPVVERVLQGLDTKEIAAALFVSTYTVQDHLKAIFEKAGVRSRRELVSRVYFDQYVPRMNSPLGAEGWFASA
ncbi:LuxR C-terminal-related transcriptional regulator [Aestuariimicrobium soli]|uniref:LuxR C-terminal-related transcriptional regulator n=1 Tax=Aestuariimicrobium soli TaxID=2035834 RepID=UPI003EC040D7